jgi:hypothetical protein
MALPRPLRLAAIVVVVAGIGLSACGDDDTGAGTDTTVAAVTSTASDATAPTTVATTGPSTTVAAGTIAEFTYAGGKVSGDSRVTVKIGQPVTIRVTSDVAEEVHIHTYDLMVDLEPGVANQVTFTADIPGIHEVELEHAGLHLTSLEVQ